MGQLPTARSRQTRASSERNTLLITCGDLAVNPHALVAQQPLFVVQSVGGRILESEVEAALEMYGIEEIILCGHSACSFLPQAHAATEHVPAALSAHVLAQFQHLQEIPAVRRRLAERGLTLQCWLYCDETGTLLHYDPTSRRFLAPA